MRSSDETSPNDSSQDDCASRGRRRAERGEVASWLILLAGLCAAAILASQTMGGLFGDLTNNVVAAAGGAQVDQGSGNTGDAGTTGDTEGTGDTGEGGNGEASPANAREVATRQARLAGDVYTREGGELPEGWSRIDPDNLPQELRDAGITREHLMDDDIGYDAAIYQNENGEYVVAFRGTDGGDPDQAAIDNANANLPQQFGQRSPQYDRAVDLVGRMNEVAPDGDLSVTGHSLGGGLASVAGLAHEVPVTAYDPAGIHPDTLGFYDADPALADQYITAYAVDGEILSNDVVPVQLGGVWTRNGMQPRIGNVVELPAIDPDGTVLPPIADPGPRPGLFAGQAAHAEWNRNMQAFEAEATRRHGMDFIHRGLDAHQANDGQ